MHIYIIFMYTCMRMYTRETLDYCLTQMNFVESVKNLEICRILGVDVELMLNVLRCHLTY